MRQPYWKDMGNNEAVEEIKADYQQRIARYEEMYSIAPEKVT